MSQLTFYGGAGEIGGNKILLEEGGAKVYLDFGESFDFAQDYFFPDKHLKPQPANGLVPYFELDLLPKVKGLYSADMLKNTDIAYSSPDIDGIFLSHHHSDHCNHLKFLDEAIPVYSGHGTHAIMDAYAFLYPTFGKYGDHDMRDFKSGDVIEIKDFRFRPLHVEHSTPGAYSYIIEHADGNWIYTGDLRMHGQAAYMTEEFVDEAAKSKPKVMLCEGTNMPIEGEEEEENFTEEGVKQKVKEILQDSKGLVFVHFAMANLDRFRSIWEACCDENKKLVVDPRYAYILDVLRDKIDWVPDPKSELCLYYKLNSDGNWDEQPYKRPWRDYYGGEVPEDWVKVDKNGRVSRKPGMWRCEKDMCDNNVTFKQIHENPDEYVLFTNFTKLIELAHIKPKKAEYIYSSSEHFLEGEENKQMKTIMMNWLEHFKIPLHKAHCSGHAAPQDIRDMVKKINPDVLIPIHTLNPEIFKDFHSDVRMPVNGESFTIK